MMAKSNKITIEEHKRVLRDIMKRVADLECDNGEEGCQRCELVEYIEEHLKVYDGKE